MTDSTALLPHSPAGNEAQASLRAQLLVELLNAQSELTELVQFLRQDGADASMVASGEQQLLALGGLQRQLADGTMPLSALKQAVSASVASAAGLTQQGRAHASLAREAEMAALHAASADTRQVTQDFLHDLYEKRIFDKYLRFDTAEDEKAYREREAARQKAIEAALAENTPEGNRKANQLAQEQLKDAGAHGADRSPDYDKTRSALQQSGQALDEAMRRSEHGREAREAVPVTTSPPPATSPDAPIDPDLLAALKGSGTVLADQTQTGHGVTVDASIAAIFSRA